MTNCNAHTGYNPASLEEGCLSDCDDYKHPCKLSTTSTDGLSTNLQLEHAGKDGQERDLDLMKNTKTHNLGTKTRGFKTLTPLALYMSTPRGVDFLRVFDLLFPRGFVPLA